MQQVGQRVFHLHAHQGGRVLVRGASDQCEMQVVGNAVAVGDELERAEFGLDLTFVHTLDGVLGGQTVGDQVGDGAHLQTVLAGEHFQLRAARHAAVGIEDFHQHASRFQTGQHGQVHARFGVTGTGQHAARLSDQREDVARLVQVRRLGVGLHRGTDGVGTVMRGDAGGDAFGGLDADREVGLELRGIGLHHRRQTEVGGAGAGQRQAHQATAVGDHEIDVRRLDQLGGHDQITFVLTVLVIDDDDHATGADFFQQFGNGGEIHGVAPWPSRRST
ncbi:hypothetical protein D3C81_589570 [compost metagenome]